MSRQGLARQNQGWTLLEWSI